MCELSMRIAGFISQTSILMPRLGERNLVQDPSRSILSMMWIFCGIWPER